MKALALAPQSTVHSLSQPRLQAAAQAPGPPQTRPNQAEQWHEHSQSLSFEEAAALVRGAHAADGVREEVEVPDLRDWVFGARGGEMTLEARRGGEGSMRGPLPLRDLAFTQLCQRIGAPAGFIRELPEALQLTNMNWRLQVEERSARLRLSNGEVRGVLGESYSAFDDDSVLEAVGEALDRAGLLREVRARATAVGTHTILRLTLPTESVAIKVRDVIEYGLDVGNSELGVRSVQLIPVTYRLLCKNGMRGRYAQAAMRLRHVGESERLHEKLLDAIPRALEAARADIALWTRAASALVTSALAELQGLRTLGLRRGEQDAVGRQLLAAAEAGGANVAGDDLEEALRVPTTLYDVANAITATARERGDVAKRLALEEVGYRYLARAVG